MMKSETRLSRLLVSVFERFEKKDLGYCVFGNYECLPYHTENDVDIWVGNYRETKKILMSVAKEQNLKLVLENKTASGSNFFFCVGTNEFIHIDLMHQVAWRSILPIFSRALIDRNKAIFNNICVAGEEVTAAGHLIYPLLTYEVVKEKYKEKINRLCLDSYNFRLILNEMLGEKLARDIIEDGAKKDWDCLLSKRARIKWTLIARNLCDHPVKMIRQLGSFFYSQLSRFLRPSGICVAFVGNDGCGKSTVVNELRGTIDKMGVKENSKFFYWRPFFFPEIKTIIPIAKKITRPNKNYDFTKEKKIYALPVSLAKLLYYVMDFIVGGLHGRIGVARGGIHIYDRHYDDLIVYPERFGMTLPKCLAEFFRFFVPQPDIIFFLNSSAAVIKERKYEIYDEELERQIGHYNLLSLNYSNYKKINGEQSIEVVTENVISHILDFLIKKTSRQTGCYEE